MFVGLCLRGLHIVATCKRLFEPFVVFKNKFKWIDVLMSSTWSVCLLRVRREDASASLVTKAMTALVAVTTVTMVMVVKAGVAVVRLKHVIL